MKKSEAPEAICVSDAETTGIDVENDRIITFYGMVKSIDGEVLREQSWTINPGVEVPKGASDVHGMTTEWVQENGRTDVAEAIAEIALFHSDAAAQGIPIVGYNHAFDLTMLHAEMRRHWNETYATWEGGVIAMQGQFFDPLVYDRAMDKYRKGGRKLMDVARHYGIEIDDSRLHEAKYDVEVTSKLAWLMLQRSPHNMATLQRLQPQWKEAWAKGLTRYFRGQGKTEDDGSPIIVNGEFPWQEMSWG